MLVLLLRVSDPEDEKKSSICDLKYQEKETTLQRKVDIHKNSLGTLKYHFKLEM